MNEFPRFIECLLKDSAEPGEPPRACQVAAQLQREGVDLRRVFVELTVYARGPSMTADRKKRGKATRAIINRGARNHGVQPEIARWLLDRSELAHQTDGLSKVHNVDSLAGLHIYLELRTRRRVTMSELAFLIEAANRALRIRPYDVDPNTIAHELRRHRQKNSRFLKILRHHIETNLP